MRAALERRRLAEETYKVEAAVLVPDDPRAHVDVALQLEVLIADPEVRRELAEKAEVARVKAEEMAREAEERAVRAAEARKEAEKMAKTRRTAGLIFRGPKPEPDEGEPCFRIGGVFVRTAAFAPSATASPASPPSPPRRMGSSGDATAPGSPQRSPSRFIGATTAPVDTAAAAEAEAADEGAATDTAGGEGGAVGAASARVREDAAAIEELIERWLDAGLVMDGEAWGRSAQQNAAGPRPWWLEGGGGGAQMGSSPDVDEAAVAMSRLTRLTNARAERLALALTRRHVASKWKRSADGRTVGNTPEQRLRHCWPVGLLLPVTPRSSHPTLLPRLTFSLGFAHADRAAVRLWALRGQRWAGARLAEGRRLRRRPMRRARRSCSR